MTTKNLPSIKEWQCDICKKSFPTASLVITLFDENTTIFTCPKCYQYLNTCYSCEYGQICNLRTDHSEPPVVQKIIQQGNTRIQTFVKNPHLIEKHCSTCHCSLDNENCLKEDDSGTNCPNYKLQRELLQ